MYLIKKTLYNDEKQFLGGFLSQYIQGKDLDVAIRCGIWAASQIVQQSGCTFEGKPTFDPSEV